VKILIACEESQTITKEYRKLGLEAYSCDVLDCSGGHPEWHIKGDAIKEAYSGKYDLMIAHPPCTYLAVSGNRWLYNKDKTKNKERWKNRELALDFVRELMNAPIKKIAIENPISCISSQIRKPDQIIQPYMFGDVATKTTCLWLKNLQPLKSTNIVEPIWITTEKGNRFNKLHYDTYLLPKKDRWKVRSATFPGIAKAMAEQWG
jgi:site-specific DNA-cytosine methylase